MYTPTIQKRTTWTLNNMAITSAAPYGYRTRLLLLSLLGLLSCPIYAAPAPTLFAQSAVWQESIDPSQLPDNLPQWEYPTIRSLFYVYRHPLTYQLPFQGNENLFNLQFINALWGPTNNPFSKHQRPAKLFVFYDDNKQFKVYPLVQDSVDKNVYVFDANQANPMLLADWMNSFKLSLANPLELRFTICNGYGSALKDPCDSPYQNELRAIYTAKKPTLRQLKISTISAQRDLNTEWQAAWKSALRTATTTETNLSIQNTSIDWNDLAARNVLLNSVPAWSDYHTISNNFKLVRDLRYFGDKNNPQFLRRITWLYPDDGCWTRAAATVKDLFGPITNTANAYNRPAKIFVFGNLCVQTPNAISGHVAWKYHTAPVIRDERTNTVYVIDPAVNSSGPLSVKKWIEKITDRNGACTTANENLSTIIKFNICNGYGTHPFNECKESDSASIITEGYAAFDQLRFRDLERKRQIELNRDPEEVLGDEPPWEE